MKNLAASTAIALAFAAPAFADAHMSGPFVASVPTEALRASDLIGARLYMSEVEVDAEAGASTDWEDVGEISDILVGSSGGVDAVLLDIGGFLGIGERTVAVNMDDLQFVSDGEDASDFFIVMTGDKAALEAAPEFDPEFEMGRTRADAEMDAEVMPDVTGTGVDTQAGADTTVEGEAEVADTAEADVEPIAEGAETEEMVAEDAEAVETDTDVAEAPANMPAAGMTAPQIESEGYETVTIDALTTEDVTGAAVYGVNDEAIGEVGELVMTEDGKLQDAIIDVGGFLGLGEKPVAVPFEQLQVMRGENDVRIYIDATEEQLEGMPEYEG